MMDGTDEMLGVNVTNTREVELRETDGSTYVALTEDEKDKLRTNLREESAEAFDRIRTCHEYWKDGEYPDDGVDVETLWHEMLHEAIFREILDSEREPRHADLLEDEPDVPNLEEVDLSEEKDVARKLHSLSTAFVREHFGEEFCIYRGFGHALPSLVSDMLAHPDKEEYELDVSVLSNYTTSRQTAMAFPPALIEWEQAHAEWVALAADHLLTCPTVDGSQPHHGELRVDTAHLSPVQRTQILLPAIDGKLVSLIEQLLEDPSRMSSSQHDVVAAIVTDMAARSVDDDFTLEDSDASEAVREWADEYLHHVDRDEQMTVKEFVQTVVE